MFEIFETSMRITLYRASQTKSMSCFWNMLIKGIALWTPISCICLLNLSFTTRGMAIIPSPLSLQLGIYLYDNRDCTFETISLDQLLQSYTQTGCSVGQKGSDNNRCKSTAIRLYNISKNTGKKFHRTNCSCD